MAKDKGTLHKWRLKCRHLINGCIHNESITTSVSLIHLRAHVRLHSPIAADWSTTKPLPYTSTKGGQ